MIILENNNFAFVLNNHFIVRHCTARDGSDTPVDFRCGKGLRKWCRFFYLEKGKIEFVSHTGKIVNISDNDILFLPYDIEYYSSWKNQENGYYFSVEFILENENGNIINLCDDITYLFRDNGYFKKMFYDMAKTVSDGTLGFHLRCQEQFMQLLYHIAMGVKGRNTAHHEIQSAIELIEGDFGKEININELAKLCHISPATFRRRFLDYANMPPIKYRNMLRLNKARELLATGTYTVGQVAEIVGINDICYFSKIYKKQFGVNPSSKI